ncbi:MAG: hypothetical protein IPO92_12860 [Saprospiraceae bacterium]|nr:hypothetical protein [Saprospiraceae bacterium]
MRNLFPLLILKKINVNIFLTLIFSFNILLLPAQTGGLWNDVDETLIPTNGIRQIIPTAYRTLKLQVDAIKTLLATAPSEEDFGTKTGSPILELPMPDGSMQKFLFAYSPIMHKSLADVYPDIKTYIGQGMDDPASTIRFDITPKGFHAMIFSSQGTVFIDPYQNNSIEYYISYYKNDFIKNETDRITCSFNGGGNFRPNTNEGLRVGDCGIRHEYRLAVSATGEYTTFHGGTVALAQAAIVTTMNRVNVFLERFAVRMIIIANNNLIVYTNAGTDPFSNGNPNAMINENQINTDAVIGNANYDIGHVFGTNSGGLAGLGVVCAGGNKARGVTGSAAPVGDPFDIDYVAHEIGHQFNGNHTQYNDACNRNNGTAVEPGSASTIMGYAGVCVPSVQNNSDAYFSTASLFEMRPFVVGNTCDAEVTVTNSSPSVSAVSNYSIPISTPFLLTASATDANGTLTYCWEQTNTWVSPTQTMPPASTNISGPVFRSLNLYHLQQDIFQILPTY